MVAAVLLVVLSSLLIAARGFAIPKVPNFPNSPVFKTKLTTPIGSMNGTDTAVPGVQRFVVRYATAARWKAPVVATELHTLTSLPPVCPQLTDTDGNWTGDEDCLYVVLYVPSSASNLITWVHGGSLLVGGANDPMIEGSKLAQATSSVVAVVQYRLGVLGFLPPSAGANGNLGVRDVIAALTFLKTMSSSFSIPSSAVTLAGQSSGATLVRALLASPSASSLFSKAVLHSDTADYAFYKPATLTTFQNSFFPNSLNCSTSNTACLNALSLGTIMSAQQDFTSDAPSLDPASAGPVPLRPVVDNSLLTTTLTSTFPSSLKPLLVTNVKNEGAPLVFGGIPELPASMYGAVLSSLVPDDRADAVLNSPFYTLDSSDPDTLRTTLSEVVTDLGFRCPDWTLARNWASKGGSAFTALFLLGATHPSNDGIDFCTSSSTHVCHQDEIGIIFGTARSPSAAQKNLIAEVQTRYTAFVQNGDPNAKASVFAAAGVNGQAQTQAWVRTTAADQIPVLPLGGAGPVDMGACVSSFWGSSAVPYDYQLHGL
ncbi:alpha/beta-hydrolase [Exidia glandulosa HHB12029]|uniref:Alpha/beta-hydrolase n=1 Tax=Exidia glandulosa HHB12029 TaxID=1314781 RepID=A0A166AL33_EXIGL|nr:alpha/beta-hydrolase [Exidia glandulosa HHB12029]